MTLTISEGETRVLLDDDVDVADLCSLLGVPPHRASSIEPITVEPYVGWYAVDFSPLHSMNPSIYACCLARRFSTRKAAIQAEVAWLKQNFLEVEDKP